MTKKEFRKEIVNHNISRVLLTIALLSAPATTFAYSRTLSDLVYLAIGYFNQAIYVIIALAVLTFIWNIYHYFIVADPENKKDAGFYVMYSVIGLFVIISFWGLVNIVGNTFNLNTTPGTISLTGISANTTFNSSFTGTTVTNSNTTNIPANLPPSVQSSLQQQPGTGQGGFVPLDINPTPVK
jgi:phosphatidylglycerophosphatase A